MNAIFNKTYRVVVAAPEVFLNVHCFGDAAFFQTAARGRETDKPLLVCLPGAGRGAADFQDLAKRMGCGDDTRPYNLIAINPRGVATSSDLSADYSLQDYAADLFAVISHFSPAKPVTLIGHAFGQRMAKYFSKRYPQCVNRVVLLAPGSRSPSAAPEFAQFFQCLAGDHNAPEFLVALQRAMFAKANDASCWQTGWWTAAAFAQGAAMQAATVTTETELDLPVLAILGKEDLGGGAPAAKELQDAFGNNIELHLLDDAGHALLPERPRTVAEILSQWLAKTS